MRARGAKEETVREEWRGRMLRIASRGIRETVCKKMI